MEIRPSPPTPAAASARLTLKDGTVLPCQLLNLSAGGAKIEVGPDVSVPDEFLFDADSLDIHTEAFAVWRLGSKAGIRFATALLLAAPDVEEDRRGATRVGLGRVEILRPPARRVTAE